MVSPVKTYIECVLSIDIMLCTPDLIRILHTLLPMLDQVLHTLTDVVPSCMSSSLPMLDPMVYFRARIHESVITYDGHISRPGSMFFPNRSVKQREDILTNKLAANTHLIVRKMQIAQCAAINNWRDTWNSIPGGQLCFSCLATLVKFCL